MPPTAHHFTPVYPLHEPQQSFRSKQYAPPRKRKRHQNLDDDESDDPDSHINPVQPSVSSHDINDPYRVAGWSENIPLPGSSFPHAPAVKQKTRQPLSNNLQKDLAALNPPLYVPPPSEQDTTQSLRRHHLGVLTTILHTSLLKHDFVRAGRAWGMILRTNIHGRPLDVRTHGRWGIGAEILMRKSSPDTNSQEMLENAKMISDQGFDAAKDYYERLILQFPFQKTNPNAISSLTFYPAMFGLCIYEIQQKCNRALENIRKSSPDMDHSDSELASDPDQESAVKRSELNSAASLAARMDELMLSPPFDAYPPLLQLRGSVALWLADLYTATAESEDDSDEYKERASTERAKAKRCVNRMKAAGVTVPEMILSVLD
ncbi:hypothetical protein E4T52_08351 [Aureobasidium sp. EXF-3400]|nr:hypothetical protein E4T51_07471 [Aureobasidium sp. EXF-12344]KAI4776729.1 hypothetical protein E4T52_08351 [Aureobasidium sp. EXF-3400]